MIRRIKLLNYHLSSMDIHVSGVFVLICVAGVQRDDDFEWLAQLRYYIEVCYLIIIALLLTDV